MIILRGTVTIKIKSIIQLDDPSSISRKVKTEIMEKCLKCDFSLLSFGRMLQDEELLKKFLISHDIIANTIACPKCGVPLTLNWAKRVFRCQRNHSEDERGNNNDENNGSNEICTKKPKRKRLLKKNQFKQSCFAGTFLSQMKIPILKELFMTVIWLALRPPIHSLLMRELELSGRTIVKWLSFNRMVAMRWQDNFTNKIGGPGKIVEIDETKIGKRKYNVGRVIEGQWVFGGVERSNDKTTGTVSRFFVEAIPKRTVTELLKIIERRIVPGTTIVTDMWRSYKCLKKRGFNHLSVNHSQNFVNPENPTAHTQTVERMWRDLRSSIPRYGRKKADFPSYLAEFTFKRMHPNVNDRIHTFFKYAATMYPPANCLS